MRKISKIFKPNKVNILMSLFIFILLPINPVLIVVMDADAIIEYYSFVKILFGKIEYNTFDLWPDMVVFAPLLAFVITYLTVAIITRIYALLNIKLNINSKLKFFLKVSKAKIIITIIGLTTLPMYVLVYISGLYEGTANLPNNINKIFNLYSNYYFEFIGAPLSAISVLFYEVNRFFIFVFSRYTLRIRFYLNYSSDLANYNITFTIIMYSLMVIEWYIFACTVVLLVKRIRRKKNGKEVQILSE